MVVVVVVVSFGFRKCATPGVFVRLLGKGGGGGSSFFFYSPCATLSQCLLATVVGESKARRAFAFCVCRLMYFLP